MNKVKKQRGNFSQVPNQLWESDLQDKTVRILGWIWSKPDSWTFNQSYMCEVLRISPRTLQRRLKEAEEKGWLKITPQKLENGANTYNEYCVEIPDLPSKTAPVTRDTLPPSSVTPLSNTDIISNTDYKNRPKGLSKEQGVLFFSDEEIQDLENQVSTNQPGNKPPKKVAAKKGSFEPELLEEAQSVIQLLNDLAERKFPFDPDGAGPANGTNNLLLVLKLYKKVGNFEDIKDMVLLMCYKWKNDMRMKQYLRPATIFGREKSFGYVQTAVEVRENPAIKKMIDAAKEKARQSGEMTGGQFGQDFAQAMYQTIF